MTDTARERLMLSVAVLLAIVYLFPLYWMYITTLKSGSAMFATPPDFWPKDPQWGIYGFVWESRNMGRYLWNSLVIATGAGAELRQALGTAVCFGMLGVTGFGLIFTPTFYVVCRNLADGLARLRGGQPRDASRNQGGAHAVPAE